MGLSRLRADCNRCKKLVVPIIAFRSAVYRGLYRRWAQVCPECSWPVTHLRLTK